MLLKAGANPNQVDQHSQTPLTTACVTGAAGCIDLLIEHGAELNYKDKENATALHKCFLIGNIDCLKQLLKHKPDTSIKSHGLLAIEYVFPGSTADFHEMLEFLIHSEEAHKLVGDDPNMTVNKDNIATK